MSLQEKMKFIENNKFFQNEKKIEKNKNIYTYSIEINVRIIFSIG